MLEVILIIVLRIVEISIIIEVLLSWLPNGVPKNTFTFTLSQITDPFLKIGRKIQNTILPNIPIDFSPIIGFVIIDVLRVFVKILF